MSDVFQENSSAKNSSNLCTCFAAFLKSLPEGSRILNVCSNSELFQRQKADILLRPLYPSSFGQVKYLSIGQVQLKANQATTLADDVESNYEKRQNYFREITKQRNLISTELTNENVTHLTRFSFAYDLFSTSYQTPVKSFNLDFEADDHVDPEDDDFERPNSASNDNKSASFILYNCARINAILEKFNHLQEQGKSAS